MTAKVKHTVESITPEFALELLENMAPNRGVNKRAVKQYARDMTNDAWEFNGEPIILDQDGRLIDGQHRLWAVIESDTTQDMLMVRGVSTSSFATIDTGAKRTAGQVFGMDGQKHASMLASTLRLLLDYNSEAWPDKIRRTKYTHRELLDAFEEHPELPLSCAVASKYRLTGMVPTTILAFGHYLFSAKDEDLALEFFQKLHTGAGLDRGHPVLALRQRWMRESMSRSKVPVADQIHLMIRAWNALRKDRELRKLQLGENFPTVL